MLEKASVSTVSSALAASSRVAVEELDHADAGRSRRHTVALQKRHEEIDAQGSVCARAAGLEHPVDRLRRVPGDERPHARRDLTAGRSLTVTPKFSEELEMRGPPHATLRERYGWGFGETPAAGGGPRQ
jgi:hypothetical protein